MWYCPKTCDNDISTIFWKTRNISITIYHQAICRGLITPIITILALIIIVRIRLFSVKPSLPVLHGHLASISSTKLFCCSQLTRCGDDSVSDAVDGDRFSPEWDLRFPQYKYKSSFSQFLVTSLLMFGFWFICAQQVSLGCTSSPEQTTWLQHQVSNAWKENWVNKQHKIETFQRARLGSLLEKKYGIFWEFFPNVRTPPTPPIWEASVQKFFWGFILSFRP